MILKSLGSGEIENGYKQTEIDTLSKYPNADQLLLWRSFIYLACSLLQSSSQWNDDQKYDRLIQLTQLAQSQPPTNPSLGNPEARNTLTAQAYGFIVQVRCVRSAVTVTCNATMVNEDPSRDVAIQPNQLLLYNDRSQGFAASEASLAGKRGEGATAVQAKLIQGAPAEAVMRFEGIPASDRDFPELDLRLTINY